MPSLKKKLRICFFLLKYNDKEFDDFMKTIDDEVNTRANECMNYIKHVGDCTCVGVTCNKCILEQHLGIDTIYGMSGAMGSEISDFFHNNPNASAVECIKYLENTPHEKYAELHTPEFIATWNQNRKNAAIWMMEQYAHEKLGETI